MADIAYVLGTNFAVLMGTMLVLWLISMPLKDVSFIDSFWALGFVLVAWVTFAITATGDPDRKMLMLGLTTVWGLRLGGYIFWRWRKEGPDKRYVALLSKAPGNVHVFTLTKVFLLQGVLLWVVSLPVQFGIFFETVGDYQMARFKSDPANAGKVMDRGLWRYTRHPNYFGDACVWWGLFLIAAEARIGWISVVGPILLTFLLVQWSGAALLERRMKRSRPDYEDYIRRTSSFIPMPPRRAKPAETGSA